MVICGRPLLDYVFTFLLWLVSIGYTAMALGFPAGARELPLLVGFVLVVFSTIDLISITETPIGRRCRTLNPAGAPPVQASNAEAYSRRRQITAWALIAALVVLLLLIGALPATALYVATTVFLLGRRPLLMAIVLGVVVAGACYLLFDLALRVDLFPGLLFS